MKIFLISPVRTGVSDKEKAAIAAYVAFHEDAAGHEVYWPIRDTDQNDPVGDRICRDNLAAIVAADEVHVWYKAGSEGSVFDLGIAFALGKTIRLANPDDVTPTQHKSFPNVLLKLSGHRLRLPR